MRPSEQREPHATRPSPSPSCTPRRASSPLEDPRRAEPPPPVGRRAEEGRPVRPPAAGLDDLRAVDDDVPAAVGRLLENLLAECTRQASALDAVFAHDLAERVARFTLDGGKRTRSQFVWWAFRACAGTPADAQAALRVGAALELIQTCALVHDDVMDGSRVRRGRPTLHTEVETQYATAARSPGSTHFGEAAAILAGDLALAWADDVLADTELAPDTARQVRGLWSSMRMEMVAGQYLDIQGQTTSSRSLVQAIRTACLKSALYSVERPLALGAALAGADATATEALCSAGRCIGIAFQLRDDLHDVFGGPGQAGKPTGGDIRSGKPTYLVAVARARAEAAGDRRALAVLGGSVGRADLSEAELARVRDVLVSTGARETVETRIDRLVAQGMRHLGSAVLEPVGRRRLRELLHSAAGAPPPAPARGGDAHGATDGLPLSLLITAAREGAAR
ncbi:geranylgeranyl diphosphate synthase type I [Streptomyces sp. 3330]|uniref:polyprenyl synthetase family protein n=1 Tax=Streptomyces sp. 3330 TaxID=2817755 RepID=UPI00285F2549|nr:polyprenyl synthetase family protein [Streptomyces sp. 3330]MDR6975996.1 geranylgeranyl diphosphate synthase type I [Streptomyces sp. 3330]